MGANGTVNHLHFQLFYATDLFQNGKLPIEQATLKKLLTTSLQNDKDDINMVIS
jgi:hypothetical protein